ncbi:hypothetical protein ACK8P5_25765 (plasmid) [Paenibacillus sp. EC2-1]|uniref:hypothetical protein n=1 Tax=Paenibacillus sp. EC2-1 TaxID=3388665 RepID=UPI003BEEEFEB
MAVFESTVKRKPGTRSHAGRLSVSGGDSPAGQWLTDPNLPILFLYDYGGPGQKEVVVSKGLLVGVTPQRYNDDSIGFKKNALTIATDTIRPFGMAPYNFTKHWEDFLDGNQPSVITREYVELPLLQNATDAATVKYGAAYNDGADKLQANDLVTWSRDPQNFGKIVKFNESKHKLSDIIGQVGEVEDDQEPQGWMKWAMWDETARREDQDGVPNKSGYNAPGDGGYPYDPEYARLGKNGENGYFSQYYTTEGDATGVPGILDGKNRAMTVHSRDFSIPGGTTEGTLVQFNLGMKNIIDGTMKLFINNIETPGAHVELRDGVVAYVTKADDAGKNVRIDFRAEFFGTPAGWDYKGSLGAVRILLKF